MVKKTRSKKIVKRTAKKESSGLMKVLEGVVLVGALAAILIKFFKGEKEEK